MALALSLLGLGLLAVYGPLLEIFLSGFLCIAPLGEGGTRDGR
jgi:hypothetical protein